MSLFDSNFRGDPNSSLTNQLAVIYHGLIVKEEDGELDPYLQIHVPAVQQQIGGNDWHFCYCICLALIIRRSTRDCGIRPNQNEGSYLQVFKEE